MISVQLCATKGGIVDVTDYVTQASWSHSLAPPYETISLALALPWPLSEQVLPNVLPARTETGAGFWAVITSADTGTDAPPALAWGRAVHVERKLQVDPTSGARTTHARIVCQSWAMMLASSRFVVAARTNYVQRGFSVLLSDYSDTITTILRGAVAEPPGELLRSVWEELAQVSLPEAFGGRTFAESVYVIADRLDADDLAPLRSNAHLPVAGSGLRVAGLPAPRGTVWQYLTATFQPHPLIELFPSLEHPAHGVDEASDADLGEGAAALRAALGGALPVLIYRMRPRLLYPIGESETTAASRLGLYGKGDVTSTETGVFEADELFHAFGVNDVHELTITEDDSRRCNAVYVRTPLLSTQSQIEVQDVAGAKVQVDPDDVAQHGYRLQTVDWPFYPPLLTSQAAGTLADKVEALSELLFTLAAQTGKASMATANLRGRFRPELRAGHWVRFSGLHATGDDPAGIWQGYAERVEHHVSVDGEGRLQATTSVELGYVGCPPNVYSFEPSGQAEPSTFSEGS